MKTYRVEEIEEKTLVATHIIDAATPFQAARKTVGKEVTLRRGEANWIRVSETAKGPRHNARPPAVFEYVGLGHKRT